MTEPEKTFCPLTPLGCSDAENCPHWDNCIARCVAIDEGCPPPSVEIHMGYGIAHDPDIPDIEDEYMDLVEDMMMYPQNYSDEQIEMVGLTLDDVYPDTETPPNEDKDEDGDDEDFSFIDEDDALDFLANYQGETANTEDITDE